MNAALPTSFAVRADCYRAAAVAAREAGDLTASTDAEQLAARAARAETDGTLLPQPTCFAESGYDDADCCTECGEHISDPHAPQCSRADADLTDSGAAQ